MKFKDWPKLPLALIAVMLLAGAVLYPSLPARIPTHWGVNGVDAWSAKSFVSVFQLPMIALGVYVLLVLVPYLDPKRRNLLQSKDIYNLVIDLTVGLLMVIHLGSLAAAFRPDLPVDRITFLGIGALFIVLGNFLGRVKQNWTMGVRMPWTLEDPVVWKKANRLGGRLFVVAGVCALFGVFLPSPWHVAFAIVPSLAIVPIVYVYGFVQYRRAHPDNGASDAG